jgi:hypothetical protein
MLMSANIVTDISRNGLSYHPSPIATLSYDLGPSEK